MKRASYSEAIEYIAMNDDPGARDALDVEAVSGYITVQLVSALFQAEPQSIAQDIVIFRQSKGRKS